MTPTRLWSRVLIQLITVVPSVRYDSWAGVAPSFSLSSSDWRIDRTLRRSRADGVALQGLDVLDDGGHFRARQLVGEAGHHRLESVHDLGERVHHRLGDVPLVDRDDAAVGQLLAAAVQIEPGGADVLRPVDAVAFHAPLLLREAAALVDQVAERRREVARGGRAILLGGEAAVL